MGCEKGTEGYDAHLNWRRAACSTVGTDVHNR
jgi:hypothetical protein